VNDGLLSESHRRRQKKRRVKWRLFRKKKELMRDSQFKFAKYLSQTYRVFIIPAFAVAENVKKPANPATVTTKKTEGTNAASHAVSSPNRASRRC
jgi:hypothetical protein